MSRRKKFKTIFEEKGREAAEAFARKEGIIEQTIKLWTKKFNEGALIVTNNKAVTTQRTKNVTHPDDNTKSLIEKRKKKVIIFPNSKPKDSSRPMLGYVLNAGPQQSEVYITQGPESLVGKVQCLSNKDFKEVSKQG
jgi:hypothetical protein